MDAAREDHLGSEEPVDSKCFMAPESKPMAKVWPVLKRTLFHPRLRWVARRLLARQFK
jgi:hypothetical protein